jgi:vacuolar-type H+-ATPase subunit E/Vma4
MAYYNEDQLLKYFEHAMQEVALKEKKAIEDDIKKQYQKEMAKVKDALNIKHNLEKSRTLRDVLVSYQDKINHIGTTYDKQLMDERRALTASIFDTVLKKIQQFTKDNAYVLSMAKRFDALTKDHKKDTLIVHVSKLDTLLYDYFKEVKNPLMTIQIDPNLHIGGFILVLPEKHIEFDCSYDTLLNEQKTWLINEAKLFVRT